MTSPQCQIGQVGQSLSLKQVCIFILGKKVGLSFSEIFQNDLSSGFRPDCYLCRELVRTHRKALSISCLDAGVGKDGFTCFEGNLGLDVEGPQQFGYGMPKISIREMDTGAQPTAVALRVSRISTTVNFSTLRVQDAPKP